jgi:hypothetical protein
LSLPRAAPLERVQRAAEGIARAGRRSDVQPLGAPAAETVVDAQHGRLRPASVGELVHADDDRVARFDPLLPAVRGLVDLALRKAGLDRTHGPAHRVDPVEVGARALLDRARERLDVVRARERIDGVGTRRSRGRSPAGCAAQQRRALAGEPERLVHRVRVERLRPAEDASQPLERGAHDVDLGLLRGQGRAGGLGVEAQAAQRGVGDAEALAHDPRPQPPRRAELRDLLEEVGVRVEEEGDAPSERLEGEAARERRVAVRDRVREA